MIKSPIQNVITFVIKSPITMIVSSIPDNAWLDENSIVWKDETAEFWVDQ